MARAKPRVVLVDGEPAVLAIGGQDTLVHEYSAAEVEVVVPPADWGRGALLNVRNTGAEYIVTLFPEEYDPRSPERAMRFANPAECQNFVSQWYMRQSHDPRAW